MVLPDPIPNSEVKRSNVDGSVVIRHVRVEHRRVLIYLVSLLESINYILVN